MDLPVEDRLSLCRHAICKWCKAFHENSKKDMEEVREKLDAALSDLIPNETLIHELNLRLLYLYKEEEDFWKQRSRQLWLSLGDSNTGYFHAIAKGRTSKNRFSVITNKEGKPVFKEEEISSVIASFYSELFQSSNFDGIQTVINAVHPCIMEQQNIKLTLIPQAEEIKEATFAINADKGPGPDGFLAAFFHSNWEVIGPAVIREIQLFFTSGELALNINKTHVRLIPKVTGASRVEDYRSIALCNIYYKIISKLLSLRLKTVLDSIISENQSAFIPGRAIAENVLITHEILHYLKTSKAEKRCTMAMKTDMPKAYDCLEWRFIESVIQRLGFNAIWTGWMMQCITTVSYSYLINDTVYGNVKPYRGIRQGDPLSPYVFILCSEVLSGMCKKAGRNGSLQGVRVAQGCPRVNHLLFADDTMFFTQASQKSCEALLRILKDYEKASRQMINKSKSSITFSSKTPAAVRENVKLLLEISKEGGLGKYLGLPEHFGRRKKDWVTLIVERIRQKAVSWSSKRLSRADKLTMLKAVLSAIPTYTRHASSSL